MGLLVGFGIGTIVSAPTLALALATIALGVARLARPRRVAVAIALGALLAFDARRTGPVEPSEVPLENAAWIPVEAVVVKVDPPGPRGAALHLDVLAVGEDHERVPLRFRVRARLARHGPALLHAPGTRIRGSVWLDPKRRGWRALEGWLGPDMVVAATAGPVAQTAHALRLRAVLTFDTHLDRDDAALARALISGDRSALRFRDKHRFRDAGQAHMLAVSGMHVGLLLGGLLFGLRLIGTGWRTTWLVALVVVCVYVPFAGAPASATRAGIASVLYLVSRLLGRAPTGGGVLAAVVVAIFIWDARTFTEAGLLLSLSAVLGILVLAPPIARVLVSERPRLPGLPPPPRAWLRRSLAVALGAWLGTAPLVMALMGELCLWGAPVSILALPFVTVLVGLGFVLLLLGPVPGVADVIASAFGTTADLLRSFFDLTLDIGLGRAPTRNPGPGFVVLWVGLALAIVRGSRRIAAVALLSMIALAAISMLGADEYDSAAPRLGAKEALRVDTGMLAAVAIGLAAFAVLSIRLSWLTQAGAAGAFILGLMAAWQTGFGGLTSLMVTFLVTTLVSKLPGRSRSGARTIEQVICNGLTPFIGLVMCALGFVELGVVVYTSGLAFLGADTVGAEIGTRYGGRPRRLFLFEPTAPGTSGAVSWVGTFASIFGASLPLSGVLIAAAFWDDATLRTVEVGIHLLYVVPLAGFLGALVDSILGDAFQYRGRDPATDEITEARKVDGVPTEPVRGIRWLDNDVVNLLSSAAAGAIGVALAFWLFV